MAAVNFPNSPSVNDTHTSSGSTWKWDGGVWQRLGEAGPQGAQGAQGHQGRQGAQGVQGSTNNLTIATSPPGSPAAGDLWWDSDDGDLHTYFNDGNSSQWVNINNGPAGAQGAQGVQGSQGHQGHQGVQGSTGSTGAQGHQGHQGVQGAAGSNANADFIIEGNTKAEVVDSGSDGHFKVETEGSERLRIDASGRILIGTTASTPLYPSALQVVGANSNAGSILIRRTDDSSPILRTLVGQSGQNISNSSCVGNWTGAGWHTDGYDECAQITMNADGSVSNGTLPGRIVFYTHKSGTGLTEAMRITSNGVLKFAAASTVRETAGITHHTNGNLYIRGGATGAILQSVDENEAIVVQNTYITAVTAGAERVRIDSSGMLHISDRNSGNAGEHVFQAGAFGIRMQDTGGYNRWNIERNYGGWQSDPVVHLSAQGTVGINNTPSSGTFTVKNINDSSHNALECINDNGNVVSGFSQASDGDGSFFAKLNNGTLTHYFRSDNVSYINNSQAFIMGASSGIANCKYGGSGVFGPRYQMLSNHTSFGHGLGIFNFRDGSGNPAIPALLRMGLSRNDTIGSNGIVLNHDKVAAVEFMGNDGTQFVDCVRIDAEVDGAPGTNDMPGRLVVLTTSDGASTVSEKLRIDSDGKFSLSGDNDTYLKRTDANQWRMHVNGNYSFEWSANKRIRAPQVWSTNGSSMRDVQVESDGTFCAGNTSIRAAKKNIVSQPNPSWIYDLNPVTFNYRKHTVDAVTGVNTYLEETLDETSYGLIAEEVETVKKDFCFYNKDESNNDVLAGVAYKDLITPLLKALQEQKKEIDTLKTKVAALESS